MVAHTDAKAPGPNERTPRQTYTAQELLNEGREEGRREEALHLARGALLRHLDLEPDLLFALEGLDTAALEALASDAHTLTLDHLQARLDQHAEAASSTRRPGIRDSQGRWVRLSPLGGIPQRRRLSGGATPGAPAQEDAR